MSRLVKVDLGNGKTGNVLSGSNAHKQYLAQGKQTQSISYAQNAANQLANPIQPSKPTQQPTQNYSTPTQQSYSQPIQSQPSNTSSFDFNNAQPYNRDVGSPTYLNDMSSMAVNGKQVTNADAIKANPLHVVNNSRDSLIQQASQTGDWTAYNNWSAQQAPLHYEQGSDGNYVQNKNYYANLLESDMRSINEAKARGDAFAAGEWERTFNERLEKYKNAPGIEQYMIGVNHLPELAQQYGINQAGSDYFNSIYNNDDVRNNGVYGSSMWYDNPVFSDETLRNSVGQITGTDVSSMYTNPYNTDSMMNAYTSFQSSLPTYDEWALANGILPQSSMQAPMQIPIQTQIPAQTPQAPIIQPPIQTPIVISPPGLQGSEGDLGHVYTPGISSNVEGYRDNQVVNNEAFERYLKNILSGGF